MSTNIKLSERAIWWTSGLFLDKLVEQVRDAYPDHAEIHDGLEASAMIGGFSVGDFGLDDNGRELGTLAARMLYTVAKDTRDGVTKPGPVLNFCGYDLQVEYIQALDSLITMFELDGRYAKRL